MAHKLILKVKSFSSVGEGGSPIALKVNPI